MGVTVPRMGDATDRRELEPRFTAEPRSTRERSTSTPSRPKIWVPAAAESDGGRRKENKGGGKIRYFLTKPTSNGTPELGEEMADEHEALLAAHSPIEAS